jgi:hypothetical protein
MKKIVTKRDESEVDRENVHGDSGNFPSAQKTDNMKQNETLNFMNTKSFFNNFSRTV